MTQSLSLKGESEFLFYKKAPEELYICSIIYFHPQKAPAERYVLSNICFARMELEITA